MPRSSLLRRLQPRLRARATSEVWPPSTEGKDRPDQDPDAAQLADLGYQPNVNQVRHEPLAASHHAEQRQEAVVRNEELGSAAEGGSADDAAHSRTSNDADAPG